MRKNKMLRLASGMMVATLLSTSVISGTFAKYVTSDESADDTAVVAKWGVTVSASGSLFGKNYSKDNSGSGNTPTSSTSDITVKSLNTSNNLVAPGTKSDTGLTFGISGTPEVSAKVTVDIDAKDIYLAAGTYHMLEAATVNETNYTQMVDDGLYKYDNTAKTYTQVTGNTYAEGDYYVEAKNAVTLGADYYPVTYSLSGGTTSMKKATEIAASIATGIQSGASNTATYKTAQATYKATKTVDPGKDLTGTDGIGFTSKTISWNWNFSSADNVDDEKDTLLGDMIGSSYKFAVGTGNSWDELTINDTTRIVTKGTTTVTEVGCLETKFNINLSVEQVD